MNTVSIIALNLGLISRGIRNVEIIDVMDYGNGIDVCFKEADGNIWCLTENIMPEEWCELLKRTNYNRYGNFKNVFSFRYEGEDIRHYCR